VGWAEVAFAVVRLQEPGDYVVLSSRGPRSMRNQAADFRGCPRIGPLPGWALSGKVPGVFTIRENL